MKNKLKPTVKKFNVFYTEYPIEREIMVEAKSSKDALKKTKQILTDSVMSYRQGWEVR